MLTFLICDDSITSIEDVGGLLDILAYNNGVDVEDVVSVLINEKVGAIVELPLEFVKGSVLVDPKTYAPYSTLQDKLLKNKKYIMTNPDFTRQVLEEFWAEEKSQEEN